VLGFYCSQLFGRLTGSKEYRVQGLKPWLELLMAWPLLLLLIPSQDLLIRFVGLRGNIFFLPFILIGARLSDMERYDIAIWLAVLNLGAFVFATTEVLIGLVSFIFHTVITRLIYLSMDVV